MKRTFLFRKTNDFSLFEQALTSLQEVIDFLAGQISAAKLKEISDKILNTADLLKENPWLGQKEPYLEHLSLEHRRLVAGNYKIIYRIVGKIIYVTDIFDARQSPDKMKG